MAKYEVTHGKVTLGDKALKVGDVLELEAVTPALLGKVRELTSGQTLEVATPEPEAKPRTRASAE